MANTDDRAIGYLSRLGAQPATSFQEVGVAGTVQDILIELGVPHQSDDYGNIIAQLPGRAAAAGSDAVPPIAFVAHLDHPGYEALAVDGDLLLAKAMGGVPAAAFAPGVPVQVLMPAGPRLDAATVGDTGEGAERRVLIRLAEPARLPQVALPASVVFALPDFQLDGDFIRMRAADDLAGCASILSTLAALTDDDGNGNSTPPPGDVFGVFTRAEEVGLVGARLLAAAGTLPADTLVVSLESSRALPGAEIGGGPVIRVGDAGFTFNADAEAALIRAREVLQARPEGFKAQRQLMSGGVCEASAFASCGYRATGIAFPLGNYHNGAPEGRIEAEFIHREDYLGGIALMLAAVQNLPQRENTAFRQRLRELPSEFQERLRG